MARRWTVRTEQVGRSRLMGLQRDGRSRRVRRGQGVRTVAVSRAIRGRLSRLGPVRDLVKGRVVAGNRPR